jgi:transposase
VLADEPLDLVSHHLGLPEQQVAAALGLEQAGVRDERREAPSVVRRSQRIVGCRDHQRRDRDLAAEVASEVRLLQAVEAELAHHAEARERAYRSVYPEQLARSLPGIAEVGGPVLQAAIARAHRFENASQFRSFTGLTPKASETGETDRKGQPMSKAGSSLLRTQLLRSAEVARTIDPQLARIYFTQMVERGANHLNALCVVGSHLAERSWAVLARVTARGASRTFMARRENQFARVAGHSDGATGDT